MTNSIPLTLISPSVWPLRDSLVVALHDDRPLRNLQFGKRAFTVL